MPRSPDARTRRRGALIALLLAAACVSQVYAATNPDITELELGLSAEGPDQVNAHLMASGPVALAWLNHGTARCELEAVSLSVRLARGRSGKAVDSHVASLRTALGGCPGFVLALLSLKEVPRFCASNESWTVMQTLREHRRRMRAIEADPVLRTSPRGKACSAAYLHELQTTRVGLRVGPAPR